ncbi:MAG: outer membrane lipoprotein-sorting protein [Treponema sp.]|jgi:outer membrane lipoprotein-sorting protein|nr:outer membrane lipoprotein-sorting protein [Treponema sp.]
MNVRLFAAVLLVSGSVSVHAQTSGALDILRRIDANEIYKTIQYEGEMIIEYQGRRNVKSLKAQARENKDSFVEFTNAEDRGTKYLKQGGRLYVYSPDIEEVMPISGHMLKESMMGSDLSYEDAIENSGLADRYDPVLLGTENYNGRNAWILELAAKARTESYPKRKLWVDTENFDLLHYELYALSGARLKEYTLLKAQLIGNRRFPVESEMRDLRRRGSKTTFIIRSVVLDQNIPDSVFSMRNLR